MLYCLLMCGGHRCENLAIEFVSSVRIVNMLRIAHKHPQDYWNPYPLLIEGLDLGQWTSSLGYLLCANGCNAIFTCVRLFDKVHCFDCMYFRGGGVES